MVWICQRGQLFLLSALVMFALPLWSAYLSLDGLAESYFFEYSEDGEAAFFLRESRKDGAGCVVRTDIRYPQSLATSMNFRALTCKCSLLLETNLCASVAVTNRLQLAECDFILRKGVENGIAAEILSCELYTVIRSRCEKFVDDTWLMVNENASLASMSAIRRKVSQKVVFVHYEDVVGSAPLYDGIRVSLVTIPQKVSDESGVILLKPSSYLLPDDIALASRAFRLSNASGEIAQDLLGKVVRVEGDVRVMPNGEIFLERWRVDPSDTASQHVASEMTGEYISPCAEFKLILRDKGSLISVVYCGGFISVMDLAEPNRVWRTRAHPVNLLETRSARFAELCDLKKRVQALASLIGVESGYKIYRAKAYSQVSTKVIVSDGDTAVESAVESVVATMKHFHAPPVQP